MITRHYQDVLSAWHGLTKELAYSALPLGERGIAVHPRDMNYLRWGVCIGFPDLVEVKIADATLDNKLHLGMSSYTKSRWTRFLRRYFRPDLSSWIGESLKKLTKYPNRPFVASYSVSLNPESRMLGAGSHGGHNYGGCLSSLQIRVNPEPEVILYSRACQIDKIGFLDLCLIHLVAKEMASLTKYKRIKATWVISLGFISAVSQVYYLNRFKLSMKGHTLRKRIEKLGGRDWKTVTFGPLKRLLKRNIQLAELGEIPRACPVKDLSLQFEEKK